MKTPFLTGPTVYLRALEPEDAPHLVTWFNEPLVLRDILRHRPATLASERERIAKMTADENAVVLGICRREPDGLIGMVGLHDINARHRHAELGVTIGLPSEWGKGYGTEAVRLIVGHGFDTLNLHRIELSVYESNQGGVRAYEKVGFQREGVLRQYLYREGRYWDALLMSILKAEWDARKRAPGDLAR